ncbi:sugar transferase [bacterium]|nr:sugar transferase [candidate division CSSED10-310 bacterium]
MKQVDALRRITRLVLFAGDLFWTPLVYVGSYWIRSKSALLFFQEKMPLERMQIVNHRLWILLLMHLMLLYLHGLYDTLSLRRRDEIIGAVLRVVTTEILILVAIYFFSQDIIFPRSIFILLWVLLILTTSSWHILLRRFFRVKVRDRSVVIVGTNESVQNVIKEIQRFPSYGLKIVGILRDNDTSNNQTHLLGFPILGCRDELLQILQTIPIDEVILSKQGSWEEKLVGDISRVKQLSTRICVLPSCYEILIGKVNHLRLYDIPLIEMIKHPDVPVVKRFFDLVVALIVMIVSMPLLLASCLMIWISMGRPIFFKQERVGKDQRIFTIYKLRTMIKDAECETGPVLSDESDARITSLGKWLRKNRFDELPQLYNILCGDMSFVGPRPERPYFVRQYLDQVTGYGERFKALPGLTGLAQVNGGYATHPENKLKYDLAYIYNYSLWLDIKIIIETIKVILTGRVNP